jgi:hypothetical protein
MNTCPDGRSRMTASMAASTSAPMLPATALRGPLAGDAAAGSSRRDGLRTYGSASRSLRSMAVAEPSPLCPRSGPSPICGRGFRREGVELMRTISASVSNVGVDLRPLPSSDGSAKGFVRSGGGSSSLLCVDFLDKRPALRGEVMRPPGEIHLKFCVKRKSVARNGRTKAHSENKKEIISGDTRGPDLFQKWTPFVTLAAPSLH